MSVTINISDGEQSPEQPPILAGTARGQPNEDQVQQPEEVRLEEADKAPVQQHEEPRMEELKSEVSGPIELDTDRVGEEE